METTTNTMDSAFFFDFVHVSLLPNILLMVAIHGQFASWTTASSTTYRQQQLFQQAGVLLLFLPTYSPDLSPIELAFSKVKYYLKEHDELVYSVPDPIPMKCSCKVRNPRTIMTTKVNVLELLTLFMLCILVANTKLYLHVTASRACCHLQLMCTFRHKPLPKTDHTSDDTVPDSLLQTSLSIYPCLATTTIMVNENWQFTTILQQRSSGLFFPLQMLTVASTNDASSYLHVLYS